MLKHADEIAMFGGIPLFETPRSVGQLAMPDVASYLKLVRSAYDARLLSRGGIVPLLERELAAYHDVEFCIALANAGIGLVLMMQELAQGRAGEVVMPAFSYRGLPHFARWAGQRPRFCDVDATSHGLSVESVERCIGSETTAILAVCNFNDAGDIDRLQTLASERSIPLFFDSVYGIGSSFRGKKLGGFGRAEVFSTHATKLLNGFEGGYITTNDAELARALRTRRDSAALNVRLNELHAAMALLSLREIDTVIARNKARYEAYLRICGDLPGVRLIPYPDDTHDAVTYQMAVIEVESPWPLTRDETMTFLRAEGAAITSYYSPPLHRSAHAPPGIPVPSLPVAEWLATRFVQLPVGDLVSIEDIEKLGERLRFVSEHADAVRERIATNVSA